MEHTIKIAFLVFIAATLSSCTTDKATSTAVAEPTPTAVAEDKASDNDKALLNELLAIHQAMGEQLPPPALDTQSWQTISISTATMRVPPDWKTVTDFGEGPTSRIHTIGALSAKEDLYVELRVIEDSDSSYQQTAMDHVKFDYGRSPDRYTEKTILGFQPMVNDKIAGKVEIMNEFGRAKNDDGSPTWRLILWDGRYEKDGLINKAELQGRFAQDRYAEFAPIVSTIISTIKINR